MAWFIRCSYQVDEELEKHNSNYRAFPYLFTTALLTITYLVVGLVLVFHGRYEVFRFFQDGATAIIACLFLFGMRVWRWILFLPHIGW